MNTAYKEIFAYCKEKKIQFEDLANYMGYSRKRLKEKIEIDPSERYTTALKKTIDYLDENREYFIKR